MSDPLWHINPRLIDGVDAWDIFRDTELMHTLKGNADDAWNWVDNFVNPIGPIKTVGNFDLSGFKIKGKIR